MLAPSQNHQKLFRHVLHIGAIGPIVAAVGSATFGWTRGHDVLNSAIQAFGFGIASLYVGYGLVLVAHAWRNRLQLLAVAFGVVFAFCVAAEGIAHLGIISANNASTSNAAKVSNASYASSQAALRAAQADVDRLQGELAAPAAMSKAQAEAEIAARKAHPDWKVSGECQAPNGPKTRAHCVAYHAAVAAIADADGRAAKEAELAAARTRLEKAGVTAGGATLQTASVDAQAVALAKLGAMTLKPSADDVEKANIFATLLLTAVFVSFGVLNAATYELLGRGDAGYGSETVRDANGTVRDDPQPAVSRRDPPPHVAPDSHAVRTLGVIMGGRSAAA